MEDINKLIENNMGLVYQQLHRFHLVNDDEAYSLAMEALWQAIKTFDVEKNFRLSTYASVCIYNALGQYVRHLNRKRKLDVISYNIVVDGTGDDEVELEYFLGGTSDSPEECILSKELIAYLHQIIHEEYEKLSGNSKIVIGAWIASDYKIKQVELAKEVNIAQATVSRILSVFKYKIKRRLEDYLC